MTTKLCNMLKHYAALDRLAGSVAMFVCKPVTRLVLVCTRVYTCVYTCVYTGVYTRVPSAFRYLSPPSKAHTGGTQILTLSRLGFLGRVLVAG